MIKSVDKLLTIIEFLSQYPNGCSLKDISIATGFDKATIHRLLVTLENRQYIYQLKTNKNYRLTVKFLHIAHNALSSEFIGKVRPILADLLQKTGETINITSRENDNIVFQDKIEPINVTFRTKAYIGMYSQMYCSAAGKCFLAFSTKSEQLAYLQRNSGIMQQLTKNTITDEKEFLLELEKTRQQGYAFDNEENESGISCVAAPILGNDNNPVYAISVSTLTPKLINLGVDNIAKEIKRTAKQVERVVYGRE